MSFTTAPVLPAASYINPPVRPAYSLTDLMVRAKEHKASATAKKRPARPKGALAGVPPELKLGVIRMLAKDIQASNPGVYPTAKGRHGMAKAMQAASHMLNPDAPIPRHAPGTMSKKAILKEERERIKSAGVNLAAAHAEAKRMYEASPGSYTDKNGKKSYGAAYGAALRKLRG